MTDNQFDIEEMQRDAALLRSICLKHPEATALIGCLQTAANILDSKIRAAWKIKQQENNHGTN